MSPPTWLVWQLDRLIPGIWPAFIGAANAGLLPGAIVTSWWRTPTKNRALGGSRESQHLVALAFDAVHTDPSALSASLSRQGFIVVPSGRGAVHAQAYPAGLLSRHRVFEALGLR